MTVAKELLDILVCPQCKGKIVLKDDESGFICHACKLLYPIEAEVPNFIIDEAKAIQE